MRWLLALLVLLPLCSAATLQPLQVAHSAADYTGTAHLQGPLAALIHYEDPRGATLDASWTLTADVLHVERDEVTAPDTGPVVVQPRPTTTAGDYPNSTTAGAPRTGGYSIAVMPLADAAAPSLAVSCSCINVTSEAHGIVTHDESVRNPNRDARTVEIGSALRLLPCQETTWTLHVTGDFLVVLWSWQTKVTDHDGATHDWSSGEEPKSITPPDTPPVEGEHRTQTYLVARGATLHYTTPDPASLEAYLTGIQGDVTGTLHLYDATANGYAGTLTLTGNVTVSSQRDGDGARTRLAGDVDGASIDHQDVLLATASWSSTPTTPAWAWWLLVVVALVGPGVTWTLRGRRFAAWITDTHEGATRSDAHHALADELHEDGHHHRALWHLRHATRRDPRNVKAWLLRGRCHHALGHHARAAHAYRAAHRILHDEGAASKTLGDLAYLIARCHAMQDRARRAAEWLRTAGRHDLHHLVAALKEPDFARVEGHPAWARLRGQYDESMQE